MTNILPPHSGPAEKALAGAVEQSFDQPVEIKSVWRADAAPENFLPWLAWALSVDQWDPEWPEDIRREVIRSSLFVHRHKGTKGSMRRALAAAGFGDSEIVEKYSEAIHNGAFNHDGTNTHAPVDHWAEYRVILDRPMTIKQSEYVRTILAATAPVRCRLAGLDFRQAGNLHDGQIVHDGAFSHGVV